VLQFQNKNITNITHLAHNTEWEIYKTCAVNTTLKTSQDLEWWVTSYTIHIKRLSVYHIYTLLMPCAVLSFLSVLLFWLPPDTNEKITLGVTILLAFFVNSLIVSNYTPEAAAELPVIGVYYTFNIFMVAISLTATVFVLNIHIRGHKVNKIPDWTIKLFKINSCHYVEKRSNSTLNKLNKLSKKLMKKLDSKATTTTTTKTESEIPSSVKVINSDYKLLSSQKSTKSSYSSLATVSSKETKEAKILRKLFKIIKFLSVKTEQDKLRYSYQENINVEWKELARRIERIFLVLSLFAIILTPILLFGKFFLRDFITYEHLKSPCGCEYSFIKKN